MSLTGALRRKTAANHLDRQGRIEADNLAQEAIYAIGQVPTNSRAVGLARLVGVLLTTIGDANVTEAATEKMKQIEREFNSRA